MIYFLPWVVFLVFVVLSVPIAAMLEKRKRPAAYGTPPDDEGEFAEGGGTFEGDEPGEFVEAEGEFEAVDDAGGGDFGDEDLSAFEEIR